MGIRGRSLMSQQKLNLLACSDREVEGEPNELSDQAKC